MKNPFGELKVNDACRHSNKKACKECKDKVKLPRHWGHMKVGNKCECKLNDFKKDKKYWIAFAENEIKEWTRLIKDLKGKK